jgi:transposase
MERRPRRKHTDEFKRGAVEMVTKQGYSISKAAKALSLHATLLRSWLDRLTPDWRTRRGGLMDEPESDDPKALRVRLRAAQKQIEELRLERDILKKATAYFAKESL